MSEDTGTQTGIQLRYDLMVERALLGVVRDALARVRDKGLPGDHHFYITFHTTHPGVVIPDDLRTRYPSEMTIVLQHQFSDLAITDDAFALTLSFAEVPARLTIPFAAVVAFADPSVQFGLQFTHSAEDSEEEEPEKLDTETQKNGPAEVVSLDSFRKK